MIGGVFAFIAAAGSFIVPAHIKPAQPHAVVVQASD
jgi:hypothetical protein